MLHRLLPEVLLEGHLLHSLVQLLSLLQIEMLSQAEMLQTKVTRGQN